MVEPAYIYLSLILAMSIAQSRGTPYVTWRKTALLSIFSDFLWKSHKTVPSRPSLQCTYFPHVHTLSVGTWPRPKPRETDKWTSTFVNVFESDKANKKLLSTVKDFCSFAKNFLRVFPRLRTLETHPFLSEGIRGDVKVLVDLCRESEECSKALSN